MSHPIIDDLVVCVGICTVMSASSVKQYQGTLAGMPVTIIKGKIKESNMELFVEFFDCFISFKISCIPMSILRDSSRLIVGLLKKSCILKQFTQHQVVILLRYKTKSNLSMKLAV